MPASDYSAPLIAIEHPDPQTMLARAQCQHLKAMKEVNTNQRYGHALSQFSARDYHSLHKSLFSPFQGIEGVRIRVALNGWALQSEKINFNVVHA